MNIQVDSHFGIIYMGSILSVSWARAKKCSFFWLLVVKIGTTKKQLHVHHRGVHMVWYNMHGVHLVCELCNSDGHTNKQTHIQNCLLLSWGGGIYSSCPPCRVNLFTRVDPNNWFLYCKDGRPLWQGWPYWEDMKSRCHHLWGQNLYPHFSIVGSD